jgi:hypothetical protein
MENPGSMMASCTISFHPFAQESVTNGRGGKDVGTNYSLSGLLESPPVETSQVQFPIPAQRRPLDFLLI